ncbi:MAG: zeta toxin family protein [Lachnospiraceae bacterium]|nr:zeta toxin family protein [Lachnospiraceae bacterium]
MKPPILYIIAGCNGAGKTTASYNVLPNMLNCKEFVNADEIARGLSPFAPERMAVQAGKLMLERIDELLGKRVTFAIETTLATRSYVNLVARAQAVGYQVHLLFFWLESPEAARKRVARRVSEGGHDIPSVVIERRYWLGLRNLFELFIPKVDYWALYDNNARTSMIADPKGIVDGVKFNQIKESCQNRNA